MPTRLPRRATAPAAVRRRAAGAPSSRCCANLAIAWLTGWPGLSSTIGTPRLIETGTARLDGMCAAIGHRSTCSTSLEAQPDLGVRRG